MPQEIKMSDRAYFNIKDHEFPFLVMHILSSLESQPIAMNVIC